MQNANLASDDVKMEFKEELPNGDSGDGKKPNKRLSVERIYQKKTQLEHILLRPDTYIGTIERLNDQVGIFPLHIGPKSKDNSKEITQYLKYGMICFVFVGHMGV